MSDATTHLLLPYILAAQAQKHVTHNEALRILDGVTVKRVLNTATTSAVYTAAQQTADWGALLEPGDTLDIRIYQLSALVGRGAPKTVTFTF